MPREQTIGIVIFRRTNEGVRFLLLHKAGPYWIFPKGRPNLGEAGHELATAFREVEEETGIRRNQIRLVEGFRETYDYDFDVRTPGHGSRHVKDTAIFYLGETDESNIRVSDEHLSGGWFDAEAADRKLFYPGGRGVLAKAMTALRQRGIVV